jgi:hypothetical protein
LGALLLLRQRTAVTGGNEPSEFDAVAHAGFGSSWAIVTS